MEQVIKYLFPFIIRFTERCYQYDNESIIQRQDTGLSHLGRQALRAEMLNSEIFEVHTGNGGMREDIIGPSAQPQT